MNSAEVFSFEYDMLTRTSAFARSLAWFRSNATRAVAHRQLMLELDHLINVHLRLREVAAKVIPAEEWSVWQELLAVPALTFDKSRPFLSDLRSIGLNALESVSLTPLPQTIALEAYAHFQLQEREAVGLVGYLWFFERMPRLLYPLWNESCRRGGVTDQALRALAEGAVVDAGRDNQFAACCRQVVRRPRDLGLATQSLQVTMELFATMLDAALQRVERRHVPPLGAAAGIGQVA